MHKLNFTILFCSLISFAFAQTPGGDYSSPFPYTYGESFDNRSFKEKFASEVEGSPLLFDNWQPGEVILNNGEKYSVEKLNFYPIGGNFLYMHNDTMFAFSDNVQQITVHEKEDADNSTTTLVFRKDIDPETNDYVELLDSGKVTIFTHLQKKPEGENYSNGIVNNTRKFVLHKTTYAMVNKNVIPVKFDGASLEQLTADKNDAVKTYIKQHGLKVKHETDFLKAVNYYNSL